MSAIAVCDTDGRGLPAAESLEAWIQRRTARRLRRLEVETTSGRMRVSAVSPSYHVRQLAEQAALELVPSSRLVLDIHVRSHCG